MADLSSFQKPSFRQAPGLAEISSARIRTRALLRHLQGTPAVPEGAGRALPWWQRVPRMALTHPRTTPGQRGPLGAGSRRSRHRPRPAPRVRGSRDLSAPRVRGSRDPSAPSPQGKGDPGPLSPTPPAAPAGRTRAEALGTLQRLGHLAVLQDVVALVVLDARDLVLLLRQESGGGILLATVGHPVAGGRLLRLLGTEELHVRHG